MKQKKYNALLAGACGGFDKQIVVRHRYGQLLICKHPPKRGNKKATKKQQATWTKFQQAVIYAKFVAAVPALTEFYKEQLSGARNVQNLAISDFYQAPEIKGIQVEDQLITITATDNFMVKFVTVSVYNDAGELMEKGTAVQRGNSDAWDFASKHVQSAACRIEVRAMDLPENETVCEHLHVPEIIVQPHTQPCIHQPANDQAVEQPCIHRAAKPYAYHKYHIPLNPTQPTHGMYGKRSHHPPFI